MRMDSLHNSIQGFLRRSESENLATDHSDMRRKLSETVWFGCLVFLWDSSACGCPFFVVISIHVVNLRIIIRFCSGSSLTFCNLLCMATYESDFCMTSEGQSIGLLGVVLGSFFALQLANLFPFLDMFATSDDQIRLFASVMTDDNFSKIRSHTL